jgi:hypothetical protein
MLAAPLKVLMRCWSTPRTSLAQDRGALLVVIVLRAVIDEEEFALIKSCKQAKKQYQELYQVRRSSCCLCIRALKVCMLC